MPSGRSSLSGLNDWNHETTSLKAAQYNLITATPMFNKGADLKGLLCFLWPHGPCEGGPGIGDYAAAKHRLCNGRPLSVQDLRDHKHLLQADTSHNLTKNLAGQQMNAETASDLLEHRQKLPQLRVPSDVKQADAFIGEGSGPRKRAHIEDPDPEATPQQVAPPQAEPANQPQQNVPPVQQQPMQAQQPFIFQAAVQPPPAEPVVPAGRPKKKGQKRTGKKSEPIPLVGIIDDTTETFDKPISIR
ncbi:MAG: hypothetical protein Q9216_006280 [Gyalolechia sp. 2 TL-2023]